MEELKVQDPVQRSFKFGARQIAFPSYRADLDSRTDFFGSNSPFFGAEQEKHACGVDDVD